MAELGAGRPQARAAREFVEECLRDPDFRVRGDAAAALVRLGDPQAAPAIERALAAELDGRSRRRMSDALRDLRDGGKSTEQAQKLRDEVDKLRGESARLRERLERLEARLGLSQSPSPPASTPPTGGGEPKGNKNKRPRPVARRRAGPHRPIRR
jgi:aminopeptidase N